MIFRTITLSFTLLSTRNPTDNHLDRQDIFSRVDLIHQGSLEHNYRFYRNICYSLSCYEAMEHHLLYLNTSRTVFPLSSYTNLASHRPKSQNLILEISEL